MYTQSRGFWLCVRLQWDRVCWSKETRTQTWRELQSGLKWTQRRGEHHQHDAVRRRPRPAPRPPGLSAQVPLLTPGRPRQESRVSLSTGSRGLQCWVSLFDLCQSHSLLPTWQFPPRAELEARLRGLLSPCLRFTVFGGTSPAVWWRRSVLEHCGQMLATLGSLSPPAQPQPGWPRPPAGTH